MDRLYNALFDCVERHDGDSEEQHRSRILALILARRWGKHAGVEFQWVLSDLVSDDGFLNWRCNMSLDRRPAGFLDGWGFGKKHAPSGAHRIWAECHLALRLMAEFAYLIGDENQDCLESEAE